MTNTMDKYRRHSQSFLSTGKDLNQDLPMASTKVSCTLQHQCVQREAAINAILDGLQRSPRSVSLARDKVKEWSSAGAELRVPRLSGLFYYFSGGDEEGAGRARV